MESLGNLCQFLNGGTPAKSETHFFEGKIPWITSADITGPVAKNARSFITEQAIAASATNMVPAGSVLLVTRTGVGKVAIAGMDLCFSQDITALIPDHARVDTAYLVHFLRTKQDYFLSMARGATIKGITRDVVAKLELPLPSLAQQRRIAAILDKADALRAKRREALTQLDRLAQSIFVEMFGDPVANLKVWPTQKLGDLTSKLGSGSTPTGGDAAYKDSGISLIRSMNVHDGAFVYKNLAFIDEQQAEKLRSVVVEENDILLNITGASVARVCRAPADVLPARVNQHVMIVRPSSELNPLFLESLLLNASMKAQLLKVGGAGATREAITKADAEKLDVIVPPKSQQDEFRRRKEVLRRLHSDGESGLAELESMFISLQQRAFRGEL